MSSLASAWRQLDDPRHRAAFYRAWQAAAAAGFTMPAALEAMGPQEHGDAEYLRAWLLARTRAGADLGTLARHGAAGFSPFERGLLSMGAEAGTVDDALRLLAEHFTRRHREMLVVRKRLAYPLFTGIAATVIAPFPLAHDGHVRAYLAIVFVGLVAWAAAGGAVVAAAARRQERSPALVRARLARAIALAIEAGLPMPRALRLAAGATGDAGVRAHVGRLDERALAERPVSETLAGCPHVTPDFIAVMSNAERTGDYASTLRRLADLYDDGFR